MEKKVYVVIWTNGMEFNHESKVIKVFNNEDEAIVYTRKWNSEYIDGDLIPLKAYVYLEEVSII